MFSPREAPHSLDANVSLPHSFHPTSSNSFGIWQGVRGWLPRNAQGTLLATLATWITGTWCRSDPACFGAFSAEVGFWEWSQTWILYLTLGYHSSVSLGIFHPGPKCLACFCLLCLLILLGHISFSFGAAKQFLVPRMLQFQCQDVWSWRFLHSSHLTDLIVQQWDPGTVSPPLSGLELLLPPLSLGSALTFQGVVQREQEGWSQHPVSAVFWAEERNLYITTVDAIFPSIFWLELLVLEVSEFLWMKICPLILPSVIFNALANCGPVGEVSFSGAEIAMAW